jgi:hypothetical protein
LCSSPGWPTAAHGAVTWIQEDFFAAPLAVLAAPCALPFALFAAPLAFPLTLPVLDFTLPAACFAFPFAWFALAIAVASSWLSLLLVVVTTTSNAPVGVRKRVSAEQARDILSVLLTRQG